MASPLLQDITTLIQQINESRRRTKFSRERSLRAKKKARDANKKRGRAKSFIYNLISRSASKKEQNNVSESLNKTMPVPSVCH